MDRQQLNALVIFLSAGLLATSSLNAATLPSVTSANLSARFDAGNINGDGGATDPGNNNDVNSWKELVGGTSLIHNSPTDGKPTFITSGINSQKTVRFVSDGNGTNAGVGDLQADDLMYDNPANFSAQTVFAVVTMNSRTTGSLQTLLSNATAGLNIRQTTANTANYYSGNSSDFVIQGSTGTFNINGNPRLDIPGGFGAAHVVKAVRNTAATYSGVRFSDNVAQDRRWSGDIAEVLFYDGVLNGNDTARVNKYLIDKYAVNQVVDERLTNTSQIANDPWGPGRNFHIGVDFNYGAAAAGSLKGINFDNVNLSGGSPPTGPFVLNANTLTAGTTLTLSLPFNSDNTTRGVSATATGTDAASLNALTNQMFYLENGVNHDSALMTFGNLPVLTDLYVQVIGSHNGWTGDIAVAINGGTPLTALWTTVTNGVTNQAAVYGFYGKSDASGNLSLNFTVPAGNFAAIGGIIVTLVPEPSSLSLLGLSLLAMFRLGRRNR